MVRSLAGMTHKSRSDGEEGSSEREFQARNNQYQNQGFQKRGGGGNFNRQKGQGDGGQFKKGNRQKGGQYNGGNRFNRGREEPEERFQPPPQIAGRSAPSGLTEAEKQLLALYLTSREDHERVHAYMAEERLVSSGWPARATETMRATSDMTNATDKEERRRLPNTLLLIVRVLAR